MSEITMNTYEGECKYCGNIQPIMAMDQTDADEKISEQCECKGAEREREKEMLLQNLEDMIGESAIESGFHPVEPEQKEILENMALAVFYGKLKSVSAKIGGSTISIVRAADKTKIKRAETKSQQWEA